MSPSDSKADLCESLGKIQDQTPSQCQSRGNFGGISIVSKMFLKGRSFHQVMISAHIENLQAKIQKAWGLKLMKEANAMLEAMDKNTGRNPIS